MSMTTDEIGAALQSLYATGLSPLMERAAVLMQRLPAWSPRLKDIVCRSIAQRVFLLLQDAKLSFLNNGKTGYFTTAVLARSIMENGSILSVLHRDASNEMLGAFLELAKNDARRRRDGLAKLRLAKVGDITTAATSEASLADKLYQKLLAVTTAAGLPTGNGGFPNMADRCRQLGDYWEFHYEATYRDLCGAVHGGFLKTTHAPSIALRAADQGGAVFYEHCVALTHAVEFWGCTVLECCSQHPNKKGVEEFQTGVAELLNQAAEFINKLDSLALHHTLSF